MSLLDTPLAIVDLETTGGDPALDRITEVGIVLVDGDQRVEWSSLVNPGIPIPGNIQRFTGITDEMVRRAPGFADIAQQVSALLHDRLFVAHNARFDHGFLRNEFARLSLSFAPRVLCSVKLSRALYPGHPRHGLDAVMERLGLNCDARHRALGDARVVCDVLDIVKRDFPVAQIDAAIRKSGLTASPVPGFAPGAVGDPPEAPGVYLFYGAPAAPGADLLPTPADTPLFVGRSRNLRSRVLSHFSGPQKAGQAARLARETRRVEWTETAGELGALLLEAKLVKQLQPPYNKPARATGPAVALHVRGEPGNAVAAGEAALVVVDLDRVAPQQLSGLYGPFRSRRDCMEALREMATAWQLCPKRIGLQGYERRTAACVNVQTKRCRGVCCGREDAQQHDLRLMSALDGLRVPEWPWPGRVVVRERRSGTQRGDRHWLSHWCYLGSATDDADALPAGVAAHFDYDHYRILRRHLDALPVEAVEPA